MKRAIVLLSGGIDSTVTLAIARSEGFEIYAISFDYGQRHAVELTLAKQCSAYFNVQEHRIIKLDLGGVGVSALISDIEVPKDRAQSTEHSPPTHPSPSRGEGKGGGESLGSGIPVTYVPARNTIFLSFALAFAEGISAEDIFIGANAVDYSGYPDCRPEFINAFENMANLATKTSVEGTSKFKIRAPLINLSKGEIIKKGDYLGVDFSLTWSCYDPQSPPTHPSPSRGEGKGGGESLGSGIYVPCKRCDSCLIRAKGFREAGLDDPLILKVKH